MALALVAGSNSGIGLATAGSLRGRARQSDPPSVVVDAIREIIDGDSWQLRYPVGPDAVPILKARASKTDEQVIEEASESDEEFVARVRRKRRNYGLEIVL